METIMKFIGAALIAFLFLAFIAALLSIPTYFLWNWLMPEIFGLKEITLVQALGLTILSSVLFKSSSYKSKSD